MVVVVVGDVIGEKMNLDVVVDGVLVGLDVEKVVNVVGVVVKIGGRVLTGKFLAEGGKNVGI
jgi:hypothetical protein